MTQEEILNAAVIKRCREWTELSERDCSDQELLGAMYGSLLYASIVFSESVRLMGRAIVEEVKRVVPWVTQ